MNQQNIYFYENTSRSENKLQGKRLQARAVESDNKMVEQAIILLSDGGINAVTLEAVGINAGYSRGLVTRRYGSKIGLLVRVLTHLENWLDKKHEVATEGKHGLDAITSIFLDIANDINENKNKYRAYFWLRFYGLESNQELNKYLIESQKIREQNLLKWLKEALVLEQLASNVDIEMLADFIVTAMMGLVHKWMVDPNFDIELRLNQLVKVHLKTMFKYSNLYYSVKYWGE